MLRVMGMPELITQTDDYVARAVVLLEDEEALRALRQRILERHSMLFEDPAPVKAFADWLLAASC
jgi:predicted O-linked N-acetylglucosamine transferase (SPINDLY family)